ncbi:MAG TPA: protein-L-isoaspartate(D-aspartate) O-methyltransferase [Alphaproteobacteria bacterium]|nr:protein-L-isoaspartate(D-aspartate) O-methyltransferase [Alphaproteobacteria bacterium]
MSLPRTKPVLTGARKHLIEAVLARIFEWRDYLGKPGIDPRVLAAIAATPRELFVPRRLSSLAYLDQPLDIGSGQRISGPSVIAVMTDLLELRPHHRVLEVGTGCGYQTAVLSRLAGAVYTVELLPELAVDAIVRLQRLGHANIAFRNGDGAEGWPAHAPFDRIILTAAAREVPQALFDQLRPGGRLVAPVGPPGPEGQTLALYLKDRQGRMAEERVMPVRFVPMVRPRRTAPVPASDIIILPRRKAAGR